MFTIIAKQYIHGHKNVVEYNAIEPRTRNMGGHDSFPLCDLGREMGGRLEWLLPHPAPSH